MRFMEKQVERSQNSVKIVATIKFHHHHYHLLATLELTIFYWIDQKFVKITNIIILGELLYYH